MFTTLVLSPLLYIAPTYDCPIAVLFSRKGVGPLRKGTEGSIRGRGGPCRSVACVFALRFVV